MSEDQRQVVMSSAELEDTVAKAVTTALQNQRSSWIDPEEEYKNHVFVCQLRGSMDTIKVASIRTLVGAVGTAILAGLALLLMGKGGR